MTAAIVVVIVLVVVIGITIGVIKGRATVGQYGANPVKGAKFPQLGVEVANRQVYEWNFYRGPLLGPLEGAHAEVGDQTAVHRVSGAAMGTLLVGPAGSLVGLSKKAAAVSAVILDNGQIVQRSQKGNQAVRDTVAEAQRFNALAGV